MCAHTQETVGSPGYDAISARGLSGGIDKSAGQPRAAALPVPGSVFGLAGLPDPEVLLVVAATPVARDRQPLTVYAAFVQQVRAQCLEQSGQSATVAPVMLAPPLLLCRDRCRDLDVSVPVWVQAPTVSPRHAAREVYRRAASTSPRNSPVSGRVSGCHCTASQNSRSGSSIASSVPSAAYAAGSMPGCLLTDWWW